MKITTVTLFGINKKMKSIHLGELVFLCTLFAPLNSFAQTTAMKANDFPTSVGVNHHWEWPSNYANESFYIQKFVELGVGFSRVGVEPYSLQATNILWPTYGIKVMPVYGMKNGYNKLDASQISQEFNLLKQFPIDAILGLEAPNEYDIQHPSIDQNTWSNTLIDYIDKFHAACKADPVWKNAPFIGPSFTSPEAYAHVGDLDKYIDYSCVHVYTRDPGTPGWGPNGYGSLDWVRDYLANVQSPLKKPTISTECGYNVGGTAINIKTQGKYITRLIAEFIRRGVKPCIYALENDYEFGLLNSDGSERPSFKGLKNILNLLKEPGANFTPGSLNYNLTGTTANIRQILLQKSNGDFYLMLWKEAPGWDYNNSVEIPVSPNAVTINLNTTIVSGTIYEIQDDGSMTQTAASINAGKISLNVPDRIMIVKLSPTTTCTPPIIAAYSNVNNTGWTQKDTEVLCEGGTVAFGPWPIDANGWTWTGPNNFSSSVREVILSNVKANQSGTYTATYDDGNGCPATKNFYITVNASPTVTANSNVNNAGWVQKDAVTMCQGGTVSFGPHPWQNPNGWSWTGPNNYTAAVREITFNNMQTNLTGIYTAKYIDANGCSATKDHNLTVDVCTGINALSENNAITIYPNPFNLNFHINVSSTIILKNTEMRIYDVCGKLIRTISITDHETVIDRAELQSGLYFYSIINNNKKIANARLNDIVGQGKLIVQ